MKITITCPECGYDQEMEIKDGDVWDARCPNCDASHRAIMFQDPQFQFSSNQNILTEASAIINGERLDSYGDPEDNFEIIAEFWRTYIAARHKPLNALDVAHMMTLLKLARVLGQRPDRDNYRDACGYLAIAADRLSGGIT